MTIKTLLTYQDLAEMGIGKRTSIYTLMKRTDFPKPLKYGRVNRWNKEDVIAWLEKQNPNKQVAECAV
ncbi:helix-turn-helix transcriptional regulator [Aggregatibacter actinomycetemcomitans]|uniref:helix-turn-helix transcriptional regulator n=1 Tax=Aggregatibacter actinomycetemcomitans TaxID=714 RepID=UPI00197B948E|nr:AlpA family phage regulatory protein [Aggregatibacter actinomycetemcomitans]MBN6064743.1 AlpA family phage regulatory protein [Aggregatibacter actinomycetemcomitans]MBN6076450.1 AlpA family phage regulatory protein [Aggregatibacter actinomycetemcomitans]MBN6081879.1 AlpA family phage regulatory protein [Aggregatibacter actinomycetemcomitans]MBN6084169.1 AlpA family phage regulatory protein [Aggregatibacter actinomycetemcomitans]